MNILLFGAKQHGVEVAKVLKKLGHKLYIVYLLEEPHEGIYYEHLKDYACAQKIAAISHQEAKAHTVSSIIEKENNDLLLFIKWRYIVNQEVINKSKYGGFVIHDSLLPKYRGFAPLNWAMINGETETGATFFKINGIIDGGPIIAQKKIAIGENDNIPIVEKKIVEVYKEIIQENILKVVDENNFLRQDEEMATYCCARRPQDSKIKWSGSSLSIHNFIRALAFPFPCAFTMYDNKKVEIIKARVLSDRDKYVGRIPGRVLRISKSGVDVLTGKGILSIEEVRVDGKIIKANSFFKTVKKKLEE